VVSTLHPRDEKVLTAKAIAYEALAGREQSLRREGEDRFQEVDSSIGSIETLKRAGLAHISLDKFLQDAVDYLDARLTPTFEDPAALKAYIAHLKLVIRKPVSLTKQCQKWFAEMQTIGERYLKQYSLSLDTLPKMQLGLEVYRDCRLRGLSGKTDEKDGERVICVYYATKKFSFESYFAIPYILSHEFWCHGLSKRCSGQRNLAEEKLAFGCSPRDAFEEGWMDSVQHRILLAEMERILGSSRLLPHFERHCTACYTERNDRATRSGLYYGTLVADYFWNFLEQWAIELGNVDARHLFFQLSLDINALDYPAEAKGELVDVLARRLGAQDPEEELRPSVIANFDRKIAASKKQLAADLKPLISGSSIRPDNLFKVLKISVI
jgi:hypothetical protein